MVFDQVCTFWELHPDQDDYSNSTFVTRHAAMHMLEEHNHLLEFYACYCYLCSNITFAQVCIIFVSIVVLQDNLKMKNKRRQDGLRKTKPISLYFYGHLTIFTLII